MRVGRWWGGQTLIRPDAFSVPAVHGVWEEWSPWSLCSFTCGRGHRTRTRMCAPPQHGGRACDGPETQTKLCNIALCPGTVQVIAVFFRLQRGECQCVDLLSYLRRKVIQPLGKHRSCRHSSYYSAWFFDDSNNNPPSVRLIEQFVQFIKSY